MDYQINNTKHQVNDIVQIHPVKDVFGGCFVTVTEVKSWGVQGYIQNAGELGQAYIRLNWDEIESTGGRAVWVME